MHKLRLMCGGTRTVLTPHLVTVTLSLLFQGRVLVRNNYSYTLNIAAVLNTFTCLIYLKQKAVYPKC